MESGLKIKGYNVRVVSVMTSLKTEGIVKWSGLKLQGSLHYVPVRNQSCHAES